MAKLIKPLALSLFFTLLLVLVLIPTTAAIETNKQDPELSRCKETCQRLLVPEQEQGDCIERCEKEAKERSGGCGEQSRDERFRACQQHCESTEMQHRPECRKQCVDKYRKEQQVNQQKQDPQKRYREWKKQCERQSEAGEEQQKEKEKCQQKCKADLEEQRGRGRGGKMKSLVMSS